MAVFFIFALTLALVDSSIEDQITLITHETYLSVPSKALFFLFGG
jgi:hypothetical protein